MPENIVGPFGAGVNETTTRPDDPDSASALDTWFQDCVSGIAGTGTKVPAVWLNKVSALFRRAIRGMGVPDASIDDDMLLKAIQNARRGVESVGVGSAADIQAGINVVTNNIKIRKIRGVGITVTIDETNGELVLALGGGGISLAVLAPMMKIEQQRAPAAAPQSFAGSNIWTPRQMTTVTANQITGASLVSGQILLPAGIYRADFASVAFGTGTHQARLRNVTAGDTLVNGLSCDSYVIDQPSGVGNGSSGSGRFTLAVDSTVELQHLASGSNVGKMGDPSNLGLDIHIDGWVSLIKES